jgi:hypothetical protein
VRLAPIPKRACARLVHEAMGERAQATDVDWIIERSEGNGFYLEELIRAAAENPKRSNGGGAMSSSGGDLPDTVIAVAQGRLERLDPNVRKVLRAASIFGDVFWLEGVSALVGDPAAALEPIIAALIEQEVILPAEQPRLAGVRELSFRNALLRATAYATLTDDDRALGHRLAAQWLEELQEDGEVVALHWLEGGRRGRAAACFLRAGKKRWARAQTDAAARCAVRALLIDSGEGEVPAPIGPRVHLLAVALEAGRALDAREAIAGLERHVRFDASIPGAARAILHAALDRSLAPFRVSDPRRDLPCLLADAACALGALSDFVGAKKVLAEATALVANDNDPYPNLRYASAKVSFWSGDAGAALEILGDTVLPEDLRARVNILLVLAWSVVMSGGPAALGRGLDFISRAEAILAAKPDEQLSSDSPLGDPVALVQCAMARAMCLQFAREYARAVEAEAEVVSLARRTGLRFEESAHLHNTGELYIRLGDRTRARAAVIDSNAIARDIGAERMLRFNEMLFAYLDGRADRLFQVAEVVKSLSDRAAELYSRYWLGKLLATSNAPDARAAFARALAIAQDLSVRVAVEDCAREIAALDGTHGGTSARSS